MANINLLIPSHPVMPVTYDSIYWNGGSRSLLFELKLTMPPTDRGGRAYSDKLVAIAREEPLNR